MDFLDKLGIDWKLFGAQLINFAVLLFVLHKFLYKPVIKILEKRQKEIESNAEKTKSLELKLSKAEEETKRQLKEAEHNAQKIIHESRELSQRMRQEVLAEAEVESRRLIDQAKRQITREREEALNEVLRDAETLIQSGVMKVLGSVMEGDVSKSLEKKTLDAVKNIKSQVK